MEAVNNCPDNLQEVIRYFDNPDVCVEFLAALRWPNGPECPACESKQHSFLRLAASGSVRTADASSR